jgi:hypothetical protein
MANRRFIDFPIAASVGNNDIVLIWQDGLNKQTTKATLLQGSPSSLAGLTDVDIAALTNGQILQYNSTLGKWENVDRTDINLSELGDVTIVAPANGQVLVYNSSTSKWENSSAGYVPYTGAVTTVNLGAQSILAGSFVKAGGTSAQFLKADGSVDSSTYGTGTVTSVALTMPTAFSVAGSPVTTTGTLAVTATGTTSQYIRGDGSLATFPALTGFVPYTGATADVNLGTHDLAAERGTFTNNGSSDTLTVNHTSGSGYGIIVTKGGANEALYVSKTSGSGNAMTVVGGRTSLVDLALSSVTNTAGDFLTLSGGVVHKRTAAQALTDIGGQAALTNPVTGTGTSGQVAYFTGTSAISSESNLFWDATNDRLGVGTNTPATTLEVSGVGLFTGASLVGNTKNGVYIFDSVITSLAGGSARALQIQALTLSFFTGATYTEKLKVFENGNVVISTIPSDNGAKLQVAGAIKGNFNSNIFGGAASHGFEFANSTTLTKALIGGYDLTYGAYIQAVNFGTAYEKLLINPNGGAVGIGTASPTLGILHLLSSSNTTQIRLGGTTTPGFIYANETNQSVEISSGRDGTAGTFPNTGIASSIISLNSLNSNSFITFNTTATNNVGPTERMRITSAGQIQIVGTAGTLRLGTNAGDFATLIYSGGGTSLLNEWASTSAFVDVKANGVGFRVSGTGNATLTGTLTQGVSDKRFKKNIQSISNPIEKLKSINGYTFEYDLDNKDLTFIPKEGIDIGVIAQEIQLVIPEAVSIAPSDRNVNGLSKSGKNYLTVNYEKIIPLLIESIKELKKEIDTLKKLNNEKN